MIVVETESQYTIFKVTGEVAASEILMRFAQHVSGGNTYTAIWDLTDAVNVKMTAEEIKGIAEILRDLSIYKKVRKVAIVTSKNMNIGLGKLYFAFADMAAVANVYKTFCNMDHAVEWLEINPDAQ